MTEEIHPSYDADDMQKKKGSTAWGTGEGSDFVEKKQGDSDPEPELEELGLNTAEK